MEGTRATRSAYRRHLPTGLQLHILSFLPPNDRALSGRLVSPDARHSLSTPELCTASLSQPLPPHAAPWAVEAGQQHVRHLPFQHKLQLLCTAAASGSEVNLEVAMALLQPSVFPELLQSPGGYPYPSSVAVCAAPNGYRVWRSRCGYWDAGVAAVKAGYPQLLGWLLCRCPGVVHRGQVSEAAAEHCSLEGLQAVCSALQGPVNGGCGGNRVSLGYAVLDAAASSPTEDALGKMEWLVSVGGPTLTTSTAAAAAGSGDPGRLRWLREQGCPVRRKEVLMSALRHADLAMAQWLVDEAGFELPAAAAAAAAAGARGWGVLLGAAAKGPDGVAKLQWLRERGAPPLDAYAYEELLGQVTRAAIATGRVQTVEYLWTALGAGRLLPGNQAAELAGRSGSIPMLQWLRQAGVELSHTAYVGAGVAGSLPVVRWLAQEAGVSAAGMGARSMKDLILRWPSGTAAGSRELLQAVRLITGAGFSDWGMLHDPAVWGKVAKRGDLALAQYLQQQQQQYLQQQQQQLSAAGLLPDVVEAGCEALLEWLAGQPGGLEGAGAASCYIPAARNGDLGTLTALRRLGVPWGAENVVVRAVRAGCSVPALRWLVEQGAPLGSREEMEAAAKRECYGPLLRWMTEQGWPVECLGSGHASEDEAGQGPG